MGVFIRLGPAYHEYAGGREVIEVKGDTVGACLDALIAFLPVFGELLFDSEGALTSIVIYRNEVTVKHRFDEPVEDGSEIVLLPMVYGG